MVSVDGKRLVDFPEFNMICFNNGLIMKAPRVLATVPVATALLHNSGSGRVIPTPSRISGERDRHRHAEPVEGVQNRATYMYLGDLSFRPAGGQSFTQQFETSHGGLDQASPVVTAPLLP
ncbi:hypothetical protein [Laribacter hongkongensis]|uniref:hypothetical protein n=1 Tax=Laribacter hongkongensis TaxID=168471 RepID=UPI00167FB552